MLRTLLISCSATIMLGTASSIAQANCNLNGDSFVAAQSNNTTVEFSNIRQKGIRMQGNAKFRSTYGVFNGYLLAEGRLQMTVHWGDGVYGVYDAWVTPDGIVLSGSTHERGNPSNSATWRANRLQCGS